MNQPLRYFFSLILLLGFLLPTTINAQYINIEETWKEFLEKTTTSDISEIPKPGKEVIVDYVRYCLIYATTNFCADNLSETDNLMAEIAGMGENAYAPIAGFKERYEDLEAKIKAYRDVEDLWVNFTKYGTVTMEQLDELAVAKTVCEKGTLAKYFHMVAHVHYCNGNIAEAKSNFEGRVLKLAEKTSLKVADVPGLEERVKAMKTLFIELPKLGKAWKDYVATDVSKGYPTEIPVIECYSIPNMKEYVLRGAQDVCKNGAAMLQKIKALQKSNSHDLGADLEAKIAWLEGEVNRYGGDVATLETAWTQFMNTDNVEGEDYLKEYCEKDAQIKAYTIYGSINYCTKGKEYVEKIEAVQSEFSPELSKAVTRKIGELKDKLQASDDDLANLNSVWKDFVEQKDTLTEKPKLADFYCDKIAQIKSWTIYGHLDACDNGQQYIDKIDELQQAEKLEYDEELACRVRRLRIKVWDCRYWELVLQARKETHEERERFGPESAKIMYGDLNSDELPCETTVQYYPLGNIGIKYVITTFLCQNIDLAKMGDPEYYKKIATWVDTQVLQAYCEESMRCKEDFFIYLEGHTDGNRFKGATYRQSLDIPKGTAFAYFTSDEDVEDKVTEREIAKSLKSNMELGIARAWTVKNQLDFMNVPISIGAYEHPAEEKGGEFRRIEIELNITNLLLDFYEKRLATLLEESGIGERPEEC